MIQKINKFQKLEKDFIDNAKKNGTFLTEEISNYCMENYLDITKIYKRFTSTFQQLVKDEFINRKLVITEGINFGLIKFFK